MANPIPSTMRAWHFTSASGGLENNLTLNSNAPLPVHDTKALGKDKLLVKVSAAALNPIDYKLPEIPVVGGFAIKTPSSPGMDFAGEVVAVGDGVDIKVGQWVFGSLGGPTQFGTLAEYTLARRDGVAVLPGGVDPKDGAAVPTGGLTAYQSIVPNVKRGQGQSVFINGGSGGVGSFGIQIAKAVGCRVVTTCSARNVDMCKGLGADEVIDYTKGSVVEALIRSAESGGKFDLVVDNVGHSPELFWQCHRYTSDKAKYVQVGAAMALSSGLDMAEKFLWPGFLGGGKRSFQFLGTASNSAQLLELGEWLKEGKVKATIDEAFPMADARKAFEKLRTERARGKVVVTVREG